MTTTSIERPESEIRAAARRRGLTMKELAVMMGVSAGYLSQIANGGRPWTPKMREKVAAVLGEVPGQGTVYRQGGVVTGESSFIRERARTLGMTMRDLADRVGVSYSYVTQVARGRQSMGVKVQARIESALQAPAKVAPARCANRQGGVVSGESSYIRERARELGLSLRDLADRVGVSYSYVTQVARGRQSMGVKVQARIESALQAPAKVAPARCANRQGGVVSGESSYIRERARELGLSLRDLADRVGVSYSYMSQVARGHSNMGVKVQARIESALQARAKVAPARCANRQGGVVSGESSYIRERARELGLSLRDLADRVGVSYSYMSQVARGHSNMGVKVQARVESALEAPAKVAPAQPACIDREAVWDRMNAHGFSQNEVARRAGISSAHLSQIMNDRNNPSPVVLRKLHGVLFQPTKAERVMPAEVKVLGWRKGERSGMVVRGAGGPGRGSKAEGGVRLPCGVRRHGPGLCDPRRRAGLLRHAEAAGAGRRLETRGKDTESRCPSPGTPMYAGFFCCPKRLQKTDAPG